MAFPAAREGDRVGHDRFVKTGKVGAGSNDVSIEGARAAFAGTPCKCGGVALAGMLHPTCTHKIRVGAATVLFNARPTARWEDAKHLACEASIGDSNAASRTVLIGGPSVYRKTVRVRVIIVKGTYWDSPEGRENIERQLDKAERILGVNVEAGEYDVVDDPSLKEIDPAPFKQGDWNSDEEIDTINRFGSDDAIPMVFTDESVGAGVAIGKVDGAREGLKYDGIIIDNNYTWNDRVAAHELGHVLSEERGDHTHAETADKSNVMHPNALGDQWTDPWKSAADKSPHLK